MKALKIGLLTLALGLAGVTAVRASYYLRQYYDTTWTYAPSYGYYYVNYYYLPQPTYTTYYYHYAIYYPSSPSYVYYYNPVSQAYWGRYELGSKGDKRYSI